MSRKILIEMCFSYSRKIVELEDMRQKDQCRLNMRKYSFSQGTINELIKLFTDCVTTSSVNMLKTRLLHISAGRVIHK